MRSSLRPGPVGAARVRTVVGYGLMAERAARARVEALRAVDHPGVCVPLAVERDGEAVVAVTPLLEGPTLAEADAVTDVGVWVWVMTHLAGALDALHQAGLAHGDVAPANIILARVPTLVDLVGGALGEERGTPGFAAPERGSRPTVADDIYALGMVGRAMAAPSIAEVVRAWTAPLVDSDPSRRPTAAAVARGLEACARPVPWRPGPPEAADPRRLPRTSRTAQGRWWRVRLALPRVVLGAATVAVLAGGTWFATPMLTAAGESTEAHPAAVTVAQAPGPPTPGTAAPDPEPSAMTPPDPVAAARELTQDRAEAIRSGDRDALMSLVVPGSEAWRLAAHQATLADRGASAGGAAVEVTDASLVSWQGSEATVAVTLRIDAHTAVDASGASVEVASAVESTELELRWDGEAWRVAQAHAVNGAP